MQKLYNAFGCLPIEFAQLVICSGIYLNLPGHNAPTGADIGKALFGQIDVFKVFKVFKDCFAYIESLCAAGFLRQDSQPFLNFFGKSYSKHGFPLLCYTCIASETRNVNKNTPYISRASEKYSIDSALVKAVIKAESNFNHKAVSPKGAKGLVQLMPATASSLQIQDSFHPEANIDGGVRYLRLLLDLFKGNHSLALAAYNAGEGAVAKYRNTIPPYRETHTYVRRVLMYFSQFQNDRL
jgi:hypothetical protein